MQNNIKETIFMSEGLSNIVDLNMNNKDDFYVHINHEGRMFSVLSLVKTTKNTVLTFKTDIKLLTELIRDSIECLEIFVDKEKIIKLNLKTSKFKLKIKSSGDSYIIKLKLKNNIVSEAKNGI
jgi:hypothetical protein